MHVSSRLSQREAAQRSTVVSVSSYEVHVDLSSASDDISAAPVTTTVWFRCLTPGAATWIDADVASINEARLNGASLATGAAPDPARLPLPQLAVDNTLTIRSTAHFSPAGAGALNRYVDPLDGAVYIYTHFQLAAAHTVFPCFDQPDLKAVFDVSVTAPPNWRVIGNAPVGSRHGHRIRLRPTPPLPTYAVAIVAGPFAARHHTYTSEVSSGASDVSLGLYCRAALADRLDAEGLFAETRQGLAFYEHTFGMSYPFAKYDQCFVPGLPAGGMENAACVTLRESLLVGTDDPHPVRAQRCAVVLHELAHMWFGDLVTLRWWNDLWLNESFATFVATLAQAEVTAYTDAWLSFAGQEKAWSYQQDRLPSTHPVLCDIPDVAAAEVNFDGVTYAKGAALLRQLTALIGRDRFFTGVQAYLRTHAWGVATGDDLLRALGTAAEQDLSWWVEQWLTTAGVNRLRPIIGVGVDGRVSEAALLQSPADPGSGDLRTHRVSLGSYTDQNGRLVRTNRFDVQVDGTRTAVPQLIGLARPALLLVDDDDLGYCLPALDPASVAVLRYRLADVTDPLARAKCWSALWEMTRDAELPATTYIEITMAAAGAESDAGVLHRLLSRATEILSGYLPPTTARSAWPQWSRWLRQLTLAAPIGSDRQLAGLGALAAAVLDPGAVELLRAVWEGRALPSARLDVHWRGRLLTALVAHGAVDPADIRAEPHDGDGWGRLRTLTATAAMPTEAGKAAAWQQIWGASQPLERAALMAGFAPPGQRKLVEPYAAQFFDQLCSVVRDWRREDVHQVAYGLFPLWSPSAATLRLADDFLAGHWPAGVHRLVSERRSELARAVTAQQSSGAELLAPSLAAER